MEAKIYTIQSLERATGKTKIYVGSTKDWYNREKSHRCCLTNPKSHMYNVLLYQHLRENNNSLVMNEIDTCLVTDKYVKEQEWINKLQPELNGKRAHTADKGSYKSRQKVTCKCGSTFRLDRRESHYRTKKHSQYVKDPERINILQPELNRNVRKEQRFKCKCGSTLRWSDKARHYRSKKHSQYVIFKFLSN